MWFLKSSCSFCKAHIVVGSRCCGFPVILFMACVDNAVVQWDVPHHLQLMFCTVCASSPSTHALYCMSLITFNSCSVLYVTHHLHHMLCTVCDSSSSTHALQVIHLLHLPSHMKLCLLKYAKGLLSSHGTFGRDYMDVLYTYLQVRSLPGTP
jgi:hypothetical protein